ncbi:MAG TPA: DinB family protein, partial [Sphingobacteriaceae bacterium]
MNRPKPDEYAEWYKDYIDSVDDDVIDELETQASAFSEFIRSIPDEKADFAYADGKWSVKELLGHVIDTERIMTYRALRFARNDKTPIPGFEEDHYVANAHFADRTLGELAEEFYLL